MSQEFRNGPSAESAFEPAPTPRLFGEDGWSSDTPEESDGGDGRGEAEPGSEGGLLGRVAPDDEEFRLDPAAAGRWLAARDRFAVRRAPKTRHRARAEEIAPQRPRLSGEQRILILDSWLRSKLPAHDFSSLVGVSPHTLYAWKKRFELEGPAGLEERPRGAPRGSRLSESTRRAILLLEQTHPSWGEDLVFRTSSDTGLELISRGLSGQGLGSGEGISLPRWGSRAKPALELAEA